MHHVRNSVHDDFQRNGDLLFDLFRGNSRPLGDDLNIVVGDVGISFDGETLEGNDSCGEKDERERQNEEAVIQSEIDDATNHLCFTPYCSTVSINGNSIETTWSPGLRPEIISCKPLLGSMRPATTSTRLKWPDPIGA